jgi:hypothetical protein
VLVHKSLSNEGLFFNPFLYFKKALTGEKYKSGERNGLLRGVEINASLAGYSRIMKKIP